MSDDSLDPDESISAAEFARRLGIDRSTESKWRERGCTAPHYELPSGSIRYPLGPLREWLAAHYCDGGGARGAA